MTTIHIYDPNCNCNFCTMVNELNTNLPETTPQNVTDDDKPAAIEELEL